MDTIRILGMLMLAATLGAPLAAYAQATPPTPPPPPPVAPLPPLPPLPVIADLSALQALDDVRWRSLGELQMLGLPTVQDTARDAMERARLAMDSARWDMLDLQESNLFRYSTTFKGGGDYTTGKNLLNQRQYEQAIARFDRVIAQKAANVDGALYWKAYAQYRLGKTTESLATIAQLRKDHAQSRYLGDSKVLETDVQRRAGQPVNPAAMDDDEMKVLAINAMQHTDPERAIPLLEGVLGSTNSLRVKRQAIYSLALINQPRAHQIVLAYAKGSGNPDLQLEAIRYIAANRNKQTTAADLMQIYQSTQDTDVKLAVISALRTNGDRGALMNIVTSSSSPIVVRSWAVNNLSGILGPAELWTLYEKETSKDLKIQMVSVFGSMQAIDQLSRIVKSEKDPDVRRRAVRALGNIKAEKTGQTLIDMYATEQDVETRKAVIAALAAQNNAEGLVALARKETTLALKTTIVRYLSEMAPKSKVAADYLMEIIK
jgi:HEAT repeat protein